MRVRDVMCADVVTVAPETPLKDVAALMLQHRISGVPVLDGVRVVGIVSETDILFKERVAPTRSGLLDWLLRYGDERSEIKLDARTAAEAMTAPAVTTREDARLTDVASTLLDLGIDRLPVVEDRRLVGIVTRSDLVRAFVRSDDELEREIREDVLLKTMWAPPDDFAVTVRDGHVLLEGTAIDHGRAELITDLVRRVPGVVSVVWRGAPREPAGDEAAFTSSRRRRSPVRKSSTSPLSRASRSPRSRT
jgi:CBS domain-containing protein